jgi:hypothetical protein
MGALPDGSVRPAWDVWQAGQAHLTPSVFFVWQLQTAAGLKPRSLRRAVFCHRRRGFGAVTLNYGIWWFSASYRKGRLKTPALQAWQ